ncbi:MAG: hypothetical protein OT477_06460 [Chloroflexi bacterium]|nr:hypothetical protein [Chloroflexota bacterium]
MNNTKLINTLAAVSLTILILVVAVGFGWRQGDETAAELESTGTVGSAASAEGGDAFAAPTDLMAKQALEAQLTQMNATIEVMQAREAEFQAQIETANGLLANSGAGTAPDPILTQQMTDLQANLAIMQQREAEYRAQLELANQRLQAQATAVTQAQSAAAPATSFTAQDDDEDEGDEYGDEYEDEGGEHEDEHEEDEGEDDHDDDHGDDDEDGDDD